MSLNRPPVASKIFGLAFLSICAGLPGQGDAAWATPLDKPAFKGSTCMDLLQTGESALNRGDIKLADKCFRQALIEGEKLGKDDKRVALVLNDLALTTATNPDKSVSRKDKLTQAIAYESRAAAIEEKAYGPNAEAVAYDLNNLGVWYGLNGQLKEGEAALRRAVQIREKAPGGQTERLALTLGSLAENYKRQKRYIDAVEALKRAADIFKATKHPIERGRVLNEEATVYEDQSNFKAAEGVLAEVLNIREMTTGRDSLMVAETLHNLAVCAMKQNKNDVALPLLNRALTIVKKNNDPEITATVENTLKECQKPSAKKGK